MEGETQLQIAEILGYLKDGERQTFCNDVRKSGAF
jgi:hypothetical protein